MEKPKWQRGRIIKDSTEPYLVGRLLWIEIAKPTIGSGISLETAQRYGKVPNAVRTMLLHGDSYVIWSLDCLELLARSEADFADDVPLIPFEQWLKEESHDQPADD